jgi:hypothetical protein
MRDAQRGRDRFGRRAIVAGHHDHVDAIGSERDEGIASGLLDPVHNGKQARCFAVDCGIDDRLSFGAKS